MTTVKHVFDLWFERVAHRPSSRDNLSISHDLIVVTDLVTDLDIPDLDAPDYLEAELRKRHQEAGDIRFIPLGRFSGKADF